MVLRNLLTLLVALATLPLAVPSATADDWISLFDGKTLDGWEGDTKLWRVEDGAITGQTTADIRIDKNSFLIWRGGEVDNFELTLEYRIVNGNSGIQYRSFELDDVPYGMGGYQADFEAGDRFSGILYGEKFRGILANRGQSTELTRDGKFAVNVTGEVGDSDKIQAGIKKEDWNKYRIVADGFTFRHFINGMQTIECTDSDKAQRRAVGLVGLQIHVGPPMTVQFRNIKLKKLPAPKKVALIAGKPSHGYGAHEHRAGCMLLAEALNNADLGIEASVYTDGWPADDAVLDDVDSIVIYCDGGGRHPFNKKLDRLSPIQERGVGLVCIHYGVEVPKGDSGDAFLDWIGGYFETDWSVNPHWTGEFKNFPEHPVTRGVKPFRINDEWYYHMRLTDAAMPILTDLPPASTLVKPDGSLARADGAHSNNPHVRAAVLERKEPQAVAWCLERSDCGRGFGFTGGHFHWNWGNDEFRKLVLNAITWTAHGEVPAGGVPSRALSVRELQRNQDYDVPDNFNAKRIEAMLNDWNS